MVDAVKCLKPGGVIIFIDVTEMVTEDLNSAYPMATSSNLDGSWHQRMYFSKRIRAAEWMCTDFLCPVIQCGSAKLGNDLARALQDVAMGFWDIEGIDPADCGGIEMMAPMGHWVTCEFRCTRKPYFSRKGTIINS
jgi:hypothetical protein